MKVLCDFPETEEAKEILANAIPEANKVLNEFNSHVYFFYDLGNNYTKIGQTGDVTKRYDTIHRHNLCLVEVIKLKLPNGYGSSELSCLLEKTLHEEYKCSRVMYEWFSIPENTYIEIISRFGRGDTKQQSMAGKRLDIIYDDTISMEDKINKLRIIHTPEFEVDFNKLKSLDNKLLRELLERIARVNDMVNACA